MGSFGSCLNHTISPSDRNLYGNVSIKDDYTNDKNNKNGLEPISSQHKKGMESDESDYTTDDESDCTTDESESFYYEHIESTEHVLLGYDCEIVIPFAGKSIAYKQKQHSSSSYGSASYGSHPSNGNQSNNEHNLNNFNISNKSNNNNSHESDDNDKDPNDNDKNLNKNEINHVKKLCYVKEHYHLQQQVHDLLATVNDLQTELRNITQLYDDKKIQIEQMLNEGTVKRTTEYKIQIVPNMINHYKIDKYLTTKMLFQRAEERFVNPKQYMEHFDRLYHHQFMKVYQNGTIAIQNFNIHCYKTGKILYVLCIGWQCDIQTGNVIFKQDKLYTDTTLQEQYPDILSDQLPKIVISEQHLIPQRTDMNKIRKILQNKRNRNKLIHYTKWTRIPVYGWINGNDASSLPARISEQELTRQIRAFADETKEQTEQIIPIMEPNKFEVRYAWVIRLKIKHMQFHIALSLKLTGENTKPVKICAIFLNPTDYFLVHMDYRINLDCFLFLVDDLKIGKNETHKFTQLQKNYNNVKRDNKKLKKQIKNLQNNINFTPITLAVPYDAAEFVTTQQPANAIKHNNITLNPTAAEFVPEVNVDLFKNITRLSAIREETNNSESDEVV